MINSWTPTPETEDGEAESEDGDELLSKALDTINKQTEVISGMLSLLTKKK